MTKKNRLKLSLGMLLIISLVTVAPTLSLLSASSDPVVNYFSGGDIALKLDEAPVDISGKAIDGDRVQENRYKYMAGAVLDKDPTVTILQGSEDCYVYVCIENQLPSNLFAINVDEESWILVASAGDYCVYRYATVVEYSDSDQVLNPVFTTVTVSTALTPEDVTELGTRTITVTAFAVQYAALSKTTADQLALDYFLNGVDVADLQVTEETTEATRQQDAEEQAEAARQQTAEEATGAETDSADSAKAAAEEEAVEQEAAEEAVVSEQIAD